MADNLYCVFYNDSDGCTYSSQSLMGIFFSQEEAETALLQHVERTAALKAREPAVRMELAKLRKLRNQENNTRKAYNEAHGAWLLECDGVDCLLSTNLDDYEIKEIPASTMHLSGW